MGNITVHNPHWARSTGTARKVSQAFQVRYEHISVPFFARKNRFTGGWENAAPERAPGARAYRLYSTDLAGVTLVGDPCGVTFKRAAPKRGRNEQCSCGVVVGHKVKEHDSVMAGNVPRMSKPKSHALPRMARAA